jgi:hypothetical protein
VPPVPLYDHFRPPLSETDYWEGFHAWWAVAIANDLNRRLPHRFKATPQVRPGARVEADVAEVDLDPDAPPVDWSAGAGGAVGLAPPDARVEVPAGRAARYAVEVRDGKRKGRLAAAVELVSPSNKHSPDDRSQFVGKCLGYLYDGCGLIVADLVTVRRANLHNQLLAAVAAGEPRLADDPPTYASAYAPEVIGDEFRLDIWARSLVVGRPLPTLPLAVLHLGRVPVDLEASYMEACEWSRIPA